MTRSGSSIVIPKARGGNSSSYIDFWPPFQNNYLPISHQQVLVSGCRNRNRLYRSSLSEIRTKLGYDQLFHSARYGGSFKIHEVRWVGHIYDEAPRNRMNSWKCVGYSAPSANYWNRSPSVSHQQQAGHCSEMWQSSRTNLKCVCSSDKLSSH